MYEFGEKYKLPMGLNLFINQQGSYIWLGGDQNKPCQYLSPISRFTEGSLVKHKDIPLVKLRNSVKINDFLNFKNFTSLEIK